MITVYQMKKEKIAELKAKLNKLKSNMWLLVSEIEQRMYEDAIAETQEELNELLGKTKIHKGVKTIEADNQHTLW